MKRAIGFVMAGVFLVGTAGIASAASATVGLKASTSWVYDANSPRNSSAGGDEVFLNSLSYPSAGLNEKDQDVNIDLVELSLDGDAGDVMYRAAIWYGDLAIASGDSASGDAGLFEANVTLPLGPVKATVGRFPTPIGYEVAQPWGNANISRSYQWSAQPINHDGAMLSYDGGTWNAGVGIVNEYSVMSGFRRFDSETISSDNNYDKGIIANVGANFAGWDFKVAGIDSNWRDPGASDLNGQLVNFIAEGQIVNVPLAFEYTYFKFDAGYPIGVLASSDSPGDSETDSFSLYVGQQWGAYGLNARFEYDDVKVDSPGQDFDGWAGTLTGSYQFAEGVEFRAEYRHNEVDQNNAPVLFADSDTSGVSDSQDVFLAQVIVY